MFSTVSCKHFFLNFQIEHLIGWVRNSFTMLAMLDYPYPASFIASLPANPVNVACNILLNTQDMLTGLADAAGECVPICITTPYLVLLETVSGSCFPCS